MVNYCTALASVSNHTSKRLYSVALLHKYSNNHEFHQASTTAELNPSSSTKEIKIQYHTGFGTTGHDWWLVQWWDEDLKHCYASTPNNYRGIIDKVDSLVLLAVDSALVGLTSYVGSLSTLGGIAMAFGSIYVHRLANDVFNDESTEGWQEHYLTDKDNGQHVHINIYDNKVEFVSSSKTSEVPWSSVAPSGEAFEKLEHFRKEAEIITDEVPADGSTADDDHHNSSDDDVFDNEEDRKEAEDRKHDKGFVVLKPKHLPGNGNRGLWEAL